MELQPSYNLIAHEGARREYKALDGDIQHDFDSILDDMKQTEEPTSHSAVSKMDLDEDMDIWRLKSGDYRILFTFDKPNLIILSVEKRSKDYQQLETAKERLRER